MHINIARQDVDTVLLDVDGALLDLVFDNYLWQKLVPEIYGAKQGISPQEAQDYVRQQYHAVRHTLNWYCLDYWSECLDLGIYAMVTERGPRTVLREDTVPFPNVLKASDRRRILLANVRPHNLAVKLERTGLASRLDLLFSTHISGYPKEDQRLWHAVTEETGMGVEKTLFVDDGEPILDAAALYGIRYCLGVANPDSDIAEEQCARHPSLDDYRRLIPSPMRRKRHKRKALC